MSDEKEHTNMKTNIKNNLNNNDYLIKLNMSDAPREVRMQWLCKMIDNEMAKNVDEIDMDLVNECQEELDELMQEIRAERASAQDDIASTESEYAGNLASRGRTHKKRHIACYPKKRIRFAALIAAAIIITSFASLSVVACAKGYSSAFELVSAWAKDLFNMNDGDVIDDGDITIIKNGKHTKYTSVEQMVREENLDIMYPKNLYNELEIEKVIIVDSGNNKVDINFIFNNENLSLLINNYHLTNTSHLGDSC